MISTNWGEKFDVGQTICAVSIETIAPLQTTAKCEQNKWCWMKKIEGVFWFKICIIKKLCCWKITVGIFG